MTNTFNGTTALTSCNKRKIADAWTTISVVFRSTSYATAWAADGCSTIIANELTPDAIIRTFLGNDTATALSDLSNNNDNNACGIDENGGMKQRSKGGGETTHKGGLGGLSCSSVVVWNP